MAYINGDGIKLANELFSQFIGKKARNVKLGHGSFITIDFGEETAVDVQTNRGLSRTVRGEWRLWIMMSAWRLDQNKEPILGSGDERKVIVERLPVLEGKKLISGTIMNQSFDCRHEFEGDISLNLFSFYISGSRQWMLFTPQKKTFIAGPGSTWTVEDS